MSDDRARFQLGIRFARFATNAQYENFKAKPAALKPMRAELDRFGVTVDCAALDELSPAERLETLAKIGSRIDADGGPAFQLGWSAAELNRLLESGGEQVDSASASIVAQRFLQLYQSCAEAQQDALEEIAGWCRAIEHGRISRCDTKEYARLLGDAFSEPEASIAPAPAPGAAITFRSASIAHVRTMIWLRHVTLLASGRYSGGTRFAGDREKGWLAQSDMSECNSTIVWSAAGVVAFGFHKYAYDERKRKPLDYLANLPDALATMARALTQSREPFTAGMWISETGRHLGRVGTDDDGADLLTAFTSSPAVAFERGPLAWGEDLSNEAQRAAVALAERAESGGGPVTPAEADQLFGDFAPGSAQRAGVVEALAKINLILDR